MSKRELLRIIAKNMSIAAADSFSTAVMRGDSAYALGNLASATGKTIEEFKQYLKDSNDGLYHLCVKTFFETTDVDPEEYEKFIKDNPNEIRLGAEILKILENTVYEEQAKMYARAFSIYIKENTFTKQQFNQYVYVIKNLDPYLMDLFKEVGELHNDGVSSTYNAQQLMQYNLVTQEVNPIQNSEDKYEYKASELGRKFYNHIVK